MMFLYVFINTAMVMGLLPVVGVPLPLVTYGGTAMLSVMFALRPADRRQCPPRRRNCRWSSRLGKSAAEIPESSPIDKPEPPC